MKNINKLFIKICENKVLQVILIIIFLLPLIATLGQYISSKFIFEDTRVKLLFWPGYTGSIDVKLPVYITIGLMGISYILGIVYMCRKGIFSKVFILSISALIAAQILGKIVNSFMGWIELQNINSMNLNGAVNKTILSLWHNPAWEEIFFTGIPLILFNLLTKDKSLKVKNIGKVIYYVLPSIIVVIYHIPNHGASRIIDTFLIHASLEYIALKYSFFAPLVMHYFMDALMVISLGKVANVPKDEITWIVRNSNLLNTTFSLCVLLFGIICICMSLNCIFKFKKQETSIDSIKS